MMWAVKRTADPDRVTRSGVILNRDGVTSATCNPRRRSRR